MRRDEPPAKYRLRPWGSAVPAISAARSEHRDRLPPKKKKDDMRAKQGSRPERFHRAAVPQPSMGTINSGSRDERNLVSSPCKCVRKDHYHRACLCTTTRARMLKQVGRTHEGTAHARGLDGAGAGEGITITSAATTTCHWRDTRINIIDTRATLTSPLRSSALCVFLTAA